MSTENFRKEGKSKEREKGGKGGKVRKRQALQRNLPHRMILLPYFKMLKSGCGHFCFPKQLTGLANTMFNPPCLEFEMNRSGKGKRGQRAEGSTGKSAVLEKELRGFISGHPRQHEIMGQDFRQMTGCSLNLHMHLKRPLPPKQPPSAGLGERQKAKVVSGPALPSSPLSAVPHPCPDLVGFAFYPSRLSPWDSNQGKTQSCCWLPWVLGS